MKPAQLLTAYYTMMRRSVVRIVRIWSQTLLPPVVTTSLYFIVFGTFIGSQLAAIHGFSYIQFIVPGLIMMSVITSSYMETVSTFYFAKWTRTIDEVLISPMPDWLVILSFISAGMLRGLLVGTLVLFVSLFFAHLAVANMLVLLAALVLTSLVFSLAGLINGMYAKSFDGVSIVPTFVLTPLTYLGGVFYSIDRLPHFWQQVSLFNPILYMVNAFRYGFLGVSDVPVVMSFSLLAGLVVILSLVVLYLFKTGSGLKN